MTRVPAFALALAGFLVFSVGSAQAKPGSLDPSFGQGGTVRTPIGAQGGVGRALAMQPDGKIVVAGDAYAWGPSEGFAVARYNADGSLDQSFGAGGQVTTMFGSHISTSANAVVLQSDGKIVLVGSENDWTGLAPWEHIALARYEPDGSLDPSFGSGGKVLTTVGQDSRAYAAALQSDGKIVVAGWSIGNSMHNRFTLVRYRPDGTLDSSFGGAGIVTTAIRSKSEATALALQPDGKIVAIGDSWDSSNPGLSSVAVARYNPDGSLDPSFGSDGTTTLMFNGYGGYANAVALQADTKIVVAGWSWPPQSVFAVARLASDGSLDPSFGSGGQVLTPIGDSGQARAIALQDNGKIVVAGEALDGAIWDFALARYEPDGSLDPTFGTNGTVLTGFFSGPIYVSAYAYGVELQPDGRIVAAGWGRVPFEPDGFMLARYLVTPGCVVPKVVEDWIDEAKDALPRDGCSLGTIERVFSKKVAWGFVIAQRPAAETILPEGAQVDLAVSKGKRKRR